MRTYGRVYSLNPDGSRETPQPPGFPYWVAVQTDPATGSDSWVYVTAMIQVLQGNLGESPFYAGYGLPAQQSVIQQIAPDLYVQRVQSQFAQHFASLSISKVPGAVEPTYNINATLFDGSPVSATVTVPE